jgi:hypothetical protein
VRVVEVWYRKVLSQCVPDFRQRQILASYLTVHGTAHMYCDVGRRLHILQPHVEAFLSLVRGWHVKVKCVWLVGCGRDRATVVRR